MGYMKNYGILVYFSGYAVAIHNDWSISHRSSKHQMFFVVPVEGHPMPVPNILRLQSRYIMVYRKMCIAEVLLIINQSNPSLSLVRFNSLPKYQLKYQFYPVIGNADSYMANYTQ